MINSVTEKDRAEKRLEKKPGNLKPVSRKKYIDNSEKVGGKLSRDHYDTKDPFIAEDEEEQPDQDSDSSCSVGSREVNNWKI
jgi:hypothetical protein